MPAYLSVVFSIGARTRASKRRRARFRSMLNSLCVSNCQLIRPTCPRARTGSYLPVDELSHPRPPNNYKPWYAGRFLDISDVIFYWKIHYQTLRQAATEFSTALYSSTLPQEALEAVTANLCILKSPTILRQADGRLWG